MAKLAPRKALAGFAVIASITLSTGCASTSWSSSAAPSRASCHPVYNGGTCYEPGEYCRASDAGVSGVAGDGEAVVCTENNGLRWEPQ